MRRAAGGKGASPPCTNPAGCTCGPAATPLYAARNYANSLQDLDINHRPDLEVVYIIYASTNVPGVVVWWSSGAQAQADQSLLDVYRHYLQTGRIR